MTADLERLYELLQELETHLGGKRLLKNTTGRLKWPKRGVYFFFEPGESRAKNPKQPRVVRVGTHAISKGARTTLWGRLRQHRGNINGNGNHRGSIFRLHVGAALLNHPETKLTTPTWNKQSVTKDEQERERQLEQMVSTYLGRTELLWLAVNDEPGNNSDRAKIESNAIGLLTTAGRKVDPPSPSWLGNWDTHSQIRDGGLWNVNHVFSDYQPEFLEVLEHYIQAL